MTDRKLLTSLLCRTGPGGEYLGQSRSLRLVEPDPTSRKECHRQAVKHRMLLLVSHYGKVEALIPINSLSDPDGNLFEDDRRES